MKNSLMLLAAVLAMSLPAHSATIWQAQMTGLNEVPPTGSPATGFTRVTLAGDLLTVHVDWAGLIGGTAAAAHIHCCIAPGSSVGVAVPFTGFPSATGGTYDNTFDLRLLSTYTSSYVTAFGGGTVAGAEAALIAGLDSGMAYSNIHNAVFPGGEIRGLLVAAPEPASFLLLGGALIGLGLMRRRARR